MHVVVPVLLKEQRHLQAAAAVVADRDDRPRRVYLIEACGDLAHRHQLGAGDARSFELPGLAHVEKKRRLARGVGEPGGELRRMDLLHQKRKRGGCSALTSGASTVSKRSIV